MADIFTPEKRSWVMSRICGSNTKIDLIMKRMLADTGYTSLKRIRRNADERYWQSFIQDSTPRS
jgi:G:T-mismatch repair DNA endonuclease (very short patch repair protein)